MSETMPEKKRKSNWPTAQQPDISNDEMKLCVKRLHDQFNTFEKEFITDTEGYLVRNPDVIRERIHKFFTDCEKNGERPTTTRLASMIGVRRETLWRWEHRDDEVGRIISYIKGLLEQLEEDWMHDSPNNATASIFALKNNYGWKDGIQITALREDIQNSLPTPDEIMKRLPCDD